jgi:tRNA 2-thiouridine synthesizing protein A
MTAKVDKKLDCLGLGCPDPVFNTRLAIDEMMIGETLEVMADDPAAESDINSLVKHLGQEIVRSTRERSSVKEGSIIRILIKKIK